MQLRAKHATTDVLVVQAQALRVVLDPLGVPLVINDDVDAAAAAGVGVHVGTSDTPPELARRRLGPDAVVGWSVESDGQLQSSAAHGLRACTYVAASPVWLTATKGDTGAALGLDGLARLRSLTTLPLVAIGGIDTARAAAAVRAGADGVAVVSAVLAAPDPEAAARSLRHAVDAARADRRSPPAPDRSAGDDEVAAGATTSIGPPDRPREDDQVRERN